MKRISYTLFTLILTLSGCTKVEKTRTAGTDTIDNTTHFSTTYYNYGFSFSSAGQVSTNTNPGPDITVFVVTGTPGSRITLQSDNLSPSFYKVGDFADEAAARSTFDNLKTVTVSQWTDMADPVTANQVWIFRSGKETYTKIRIVSIVNEARQGVAYGECTFQWVYQPDGSLTFPGK